MKKGIGTLIFAVICFAIIAVAFNYFFLEDIIIPDPCYYHNNDFKTSALFDSFYCFPSSEGGHPFPTLFNFIFTIIVGAAVGAILWWLIHKRAAIKDRNRKMHKILRLTLELLDESTDTDWSHATVDEMKQLLAQSMDALKNGKEVDKLELKTAFAPTSSLQEIAMANSWHQQYLDLSARFDGLIEKL